MRCEKYYGDKATRDTKTCGGGINIYMMILKEHLKGLNVEVLDNLDFVYKACEWLWMSLQSLDQHS